MYDTISFDFRTSLRSSLLRIYVKAFGEMYYKSIRKICDRNLKLYLRHSCRCQAITSVMTNN